MRKYMRGSQENHARSLLARFDDGALVAPEELPEALIIVFDSDLRFTLVAGHALARQADPSIFQEGHAISEAFPAELWERIEPLFRSALEGETRSRRIRTVDGRHSLTIDIGPLGLGAPEKPATIAGGVAVVLDVSKAEPAEQPEPSPLSSREHFEQVFERAPIGTGLLDQEGRWVLVNKALCEITGYTSQELIGKRFQEITHPEDAGNDAIRREQLLKGEISAFQSEKRYVNAAGETMSAIISTSLVRDQQDNPLHFILQIQDISERKQLEEHLRHLADHDPLTGLRNRRLFEHDLKLQIGRCHRYGEEAALIVIDLDSFKQVNDLHGHKVGDDALKIVAKTLTRRLRTTDLLARLSGDEFAVLLPHVDREGAEIVTQDIMRVIESSSVDTGETVVHLSGSAGFALIEKHTLSDEDAFVQADRAMYAAKRARTGALRPR
ncbi:MAG TPA: diguanylate cyclase [Solirubrobacteraceae bacterium]|jgi:diguanylate cyclase (GGDEF)-like protein/PAS domain S-box-containing protein|nr:diguanylate cyclase [Solirubrobacteraceae bacterium]